MSLDDTKGAFTLVVKVYHRGMSDQFPNGGTMSQHLAALKVSTAVPLFSLRVWGVGFRGTGITFVRFLFVGASALVVEARPNPWRTGKT